VIASVDSLALGVHLHASLTVELGQAVEVNLGSLDDLDLAHMAILDGVDWLGSLYDISSDAIGQKLLDELWDIGVADIGDDDLGHLLSDLLDLLRLSVRGLLDLALVGLLGESGDEHSNVVVVGGLDIYRASDHGLPLFDHRANLVACEAHAVEVQDAVLALDILAHEFELSEASSVVVEVGLVAVEHSALEAIGGHSVTGGSGDEGLTDLSDLEHRRGFDVIPILLGEWIDDLLLTALFATL